jgi:16S rRNA (cytosine1402-N4)-methyltransferase
MELKYHEPVMLEECMQGLDIQPGGIYVDATFGGGGHSREIISRLKDGRLIVFDQDEDALQNAIDDKRFLLVQHNFRYLKNFLRYYKAIPIQGLLADLGISSHQIDVPERGFSHRFDADLDMRMDKGSALSAREVINNYTPDKLKSIFMLYGEIENSWKLTQAIIKGRAKVPINTVEELKQCIMSCMPRGKESKYLSKVFQALRIEVNQELEALKALLEQSAEVIEKGGRLVIMSYHSLEDRMVKNFMNTGTFSGEADKDEYGNVNKPFKTITRKPIVASDKELELNPRSRSARLRIAEKV